MIVYRWTVDGKLVKVHYEYCIKSSAGVVYNIFEDSLCNEYLWPDDGSDYVERVPDEISVKEFIYERELER